MKFLLILVFAMLIGFSSCKTYESMNDDFHNAYRITRIKPTSVGYVIYAKKGDKLYQIISSKAADSNNKNCERIKRRNRYYLDLEVVHPSPDIATRSIVMKFGRLKMPLKKRYHYKIYKANNLHGLCIINEAN